MSHHHDPTRDEDPSRHSSASWGVFPDAAEVCGVYQFIYRHVGNREEAEELTERACTLAARAASQLAPGVSKLQCMASALCKAARSVVEEHRARFYAATSESLPGGESGDQSAGLAVRAGSDGSVPEPLGTVLAQLSVYERDFLTYRFLRNGSLAETAAQMRLSVADALALQWTAVTNAARLLARERMKQTASGARPGEGASGTYPAASGAGPRRRSAACACRAARTE